MQLRGVVLDVDGTVLRGDEAVDGALEGLEAFATAGVDRLFVTNNPTATPDRQSTANRRIGSISRAESRNRATWLDAPNRTPRFGLTPDSVRVIRPSTAAVSPGSSA